MFGLHMAMMLWWVCLADGLPSQFNTVQFLQPATSFAARTDHFTHNFKIPKLSSNRIGSIDLSSGIWPSSLNDWKLHQGFFQHNSLNFDKSFGTSHFTPDFSNGLAYPDPFLSTGIDAKRKADYLYSKELFFKDIPHTRSLLFNQQQRIDNDLTPHQLGSLRPSSPWYRFRGTGTFRGSNSFFNYKNTFSI